MQNGFESHHWTDEYENPAGGCTMGTGFTISWQHGPLGRDENRIEPNGAFVEDIIVATIDRLTFYQDSKFHCTENAHAIDFLSEALAVLENRTKDREKRKVECPPGKDTECAQALADILGECEDIEEVKEDEVIKQVKENIGWII